MAGVGVPISQRRVVSPFVYFPEGREGSSAAIAAAELRGRPAK
jgi:hypothetical protein